MKPLRKSAPLFVGLSCLALMPPTGPRAPFAGTPAPELAPELEPLRPFIGSWIGHFDDPDETMEIFATWSVVVGGQAVREVRTVPDAGAFESHTIIFQRR